MASYPAEFTAAITSFLVKGVPAATGTVTVSSSLPFFCILRITVAFFSGAAVVVTVVVSVVVSVTDSVAADVVVFVPNSLDVRSLVVRSLDVRSL